MITDAGLWRTWRAGIADPIAWRALRFLCWLSEIGT